MWSCELSAPPARKGTRACPALRRDARSAAAQKLRWCQDCPLLSPPGYPGGLRPLGATLPAAPLHDFVRTVSSFWWWGPSSLAGRPSCNRSSMKTLLGPQALPATFGTTARGSSTSTGGVSRRERLAVGLNLFGTHRATDEVFSNGMRRWSATVRKAVGEIRDSRPGGRRPFHGPLNRTFGRRCFAQSESALALGSHNRLICFMFALRG
jgi:hypothetical protein